MEIPKIRQLWKMIDPIVEGLSPRIFGTLSSEVSRLNRLLWMGNPQRKMPYQTWVTRGEEEMHLSRNDIQTGLSRQRLYNELHEILSKSWPCMCAENHEQKLGSCMKFKLRLQSSWIRSESNSAEFDIILQHEQASFDCNIRIVTEE